MLKNFFGKIFPDVIQTRRRLRSDMPRKIVITFFPKSSIRIKSSKLHTLRFSSDFSFFDYKVFFVFISIKIIVLKQILNVLIPQHFVIFFTNLLLSIFTKILQISKHALNIRYERRFHFSALQSSPVKINQPRMVPQLFDSIFTQSFMRLSAYKSINEIN